MVRVRCDPRIVDDRASTGRRKCDGFIEEGGVKMTVRLTKAFSTTDTTKMPTTSAVTWNEGFNAQSGSIEYLLLRGDCTFGADPVANGDASNLVSSLRVIIDGEVVHDFRAGYENTTAGLYGYFLNAAGGKAGETADGTTTREWYWAIPIGRNYSSQIRVEIVVAFAATDATATISSGSLEWWVKYNSAIQATTTVAPATSFTHSAAIEQVVVRVPTNVPSGSVVSALLVQNDSGSDGLGSQGIRINALSDYGLEAEMLRFLNGDMFNGIQYNMAAGSGIQAFTTEVKGVWLIPVFGLAGGDIVLQVDSSEATTRTYTPVLTAPVGGKESSDVKQTQRQTSNTAKAILNRATE